MDRRIVDAADRTRATAGAPKLFGEFFRASNAKKAKIEGTGVGLAGVKNLVERFDGQLTLETQENDGTTFTVQLPLHRPSQR